MEYIKKEIFHEHHPAFKTAQNPLRRFFRRGKGGIFKKTFCPRLFVPENFSSPAIIHRDKTVSVLTGFASGILFSQPAENLKKYGVLKIDYSELSPENLRSGWYESRKSFLD
ncbi:MAG: hypothetical protein J6A12_00915 [Oscillospiraceae bacterium]|nr:hypothetical protein [Oscillospiraceae bacterium]